MSDLLHTIHVVTDYVVYLALGFVAGRDLKRWRKKRITRAEEDLWHKACYTPATQIDALGLGLEKWVQLHRARNPSTCILRQGLFDRWYIFHPHNTRRAWSGSEWVPCSSDGMPHQVQVCNFDSEREASEYCAYVGLVPLSPAGIRIAEKINGGTG